MNHILQNLSYVTNIEALEQIAGTPSKLVENKVISSLDHHCLDFISKTPFIVLSTSNASGACDSSPRGDEPGFIHVIDEQHFLIPERPGNRRMDSLKNLIENDRIGILFIIPGLKETLRINGSAMITNDPKLLKECEHVGKEPKLGILVKVEECYMHCGKALIRSQLWEPDTWLEKENLPKAHVILADHAKTLNMTKDEVACSLEETYTKRLY
ncbi:pyridoxamine 5'-phosphate oxidase family protein [Peribacillus alkalitolerans]|uniref:pyridoxamine 5'-phosphate oxidase family protein n=1 Tax=Peribacillus alkalitolerans TaxID=1550385 RepID=UPI0013D3A1FA|nr:pyridoxamine 5'-phosphate oxidase family protein [Peribacillus alkalitolerans]